MKEDRKQEQLTFLDQFFLTTKEAIELSGVSQQTFYELMKRKKISKIKLNGVVLYKKNELEQLLLKRECKEDDDVQ